MQVDAASASVSVHTFGPNCPHCGDGRSGTRCDLGGYSTRRVKFIMAHRDAYEAAYLNPTGHAASNEMERLEREYRTLPTRHSCSCWPGHCLECKRLAKQREGAGCPRHGKGYVAECWECNLSDLGIEIGRTSPVHAAMPAATMLDLARAEDVVGATADAAALARYMSLDGASIRPVVDRGQALPSALTAPTRAVQRKTRFTVEHELLCLMCSRTAATGQRCCASCGGSIVLSAVF